MFFVAAGCQQTILFVCLLSLDRQLLLAYTYFIFRMIHRLIFLSSFRPFSSR